MYVASYKGTRSGLKGLFNIGCRLVLRSWYSHSELLLFNDSHPLVPRVTGYSVEFAAGVRKKVFTLDWYKWDVVEIPYNAHAILKFEEWIAQRRRYDVLGLVFIRTWFIHNILMLIRGYRQQHNRRMWCSEAVANAIFSTPEMEYTEGWRFDPAVLHECVTLQYERVNRW